MNKLLEQINADKQEMALGDVVTFHRGYDLPLTEIKKGIYPVVFSNGRKEYHNEFKVKAPGVFTGRSGSLGGMFYVDEDYWPHNTTLYVSDFHNNNPRYCYYFLSSFDFSKYNVGTGVPTLNRNHIHGIPVKISSLPIQNKIADILSAYDAKIENNNKIIKNLELMAQIIFNEWFVKFRFPGHEKTKFVDSKIGEIPEGWEIKSLDNVADFLNGVASQKFPARDKNDSIPVIKIREMNSGVDKNSDRATKNIDTKYIVKNGDVLFSWSGSLELMLWSDGDGLLNQHIFKVTSGQYPSWLIYQWIKIHLQNFRAVASGKATTMGHIQREHLTQSLVLAPNKDILKKADSLLSKLFNKELTLRLENKLLKESRDKLLAKLI